MDELTRAELAEQAEQLGVPTSGTKAQLKRRLRKTDTGQCPYCRYRTPAGRKTLAFHVKQMHRKEL